MSNPNVNSWANIPVISKNSVTNQKPIIARPWSQMRNTRKSNKQDRYKDLSKNWSQNKDFAWLWNYFPNSNLKGNISSDYDIEESKRLFTHSRDNESIKIKENTKRKMDFISSSSDRLESPHSFLSNSLKPSKSYMMSISQKPPIDNFKPIRNILGIDGT